MVVRTEEKIKNWVHDFIADDPSLFVVDISLKGNPGNQKLVITLDGDKGITIDKCAEVSRRVGAKIEEEDLIPGKYNLEVSSAGMGVPLKVARQYTKNQGRQVEVTLKNGEKVTGKLTDSNAQGLTLEIDEKKEAFAFSEIEKTTVVVSFK